MMCMVPISNIALGTLSPQRIQGASGLFNLTRNLGGAVGLAIINTMLTQRSDAHYARLSEHVNYGNPAAMDWLNNVGANYDSFGLDGASVALQKLSGMITQQAWLLSFMDVFYILTVLFGSLIFFVFLIAKPASPAGGGGGGH